MATSYLERSREHRCELGIANSPRLFCTLAGKPLQASYVRNLLPRLLRKAGVAKRVHPRGLRHSGAYAMRTGGIDIGIISKALGHSSIATTARYLDHI